VSERESIRLDARPLWAWIAERHAIYLRKAERDGDRIPAWASTYARPPRLADGQLTLDPVLAEYRFCNAFRELDRVTVWIRERIREPFAGSPYLWVMLAAARAINWPPTLAELIDRGAWPSDSRFDPRRMGKIMVARRDRGEKVETGAYMIRAESRPEAPWYSWPKGRYVAEVVVGRLWERRNEICAKLAGVNSIEAAVDLLWRDRELIGWGPFMAYEWATDLRHTHHLRDAVDIMTWANPGPGARRGLNRLAGRDPRAPLRRGDAVELMRELLAESRERGRLAPWVPALEMRDVEMSLCEVDKYLRVTSGQGRPRARYVPGRGC